jgi:putative DNA primase/helicase
VTAALPSVSRPVELVLARLTNPRRSGGGWVARCPAHDDREPSLSIREGRDGRVLLNCHAGCTFDAVVAALGLTQADTFPPSIQSASTNGNGRPSDAPAAPRSRLVKTYDYTDADGALLFQVCRFVTSDGNKTFRQRRPDGKGDWIWGLGEMEPVLYQLPAVRAAVESGRRLFIVEGEKDADALTEQRYVATTAPMGAGKWREAFSAELRGAEVVILPDNDAPGRSHAEQVAASLTAAGATVRVVPLPNLPPKGDISDWLDAGHNLDALEALIGETPRWGADPDAKDCWRLDELLENDAVMRPPMPIVPRLVWAARSTLLAAGEKSGKSTLTGYLAAQVSRGRTFLGEPCESGVVLIVGLEEYIGDCARRLRDFDADPVRVHVMHKLPSDPDARPSAIMARIQELRPVLVIVDSLIAYGRYRDSSAIGGAVDVIAEVFTPDPDADPTLRRVRVVGRVPGHDFQMRFNGHHYALDGGEEAPLPQRVTAYVRTHPGCSVRDVLEAMRTRHADTQKTITSLLTSRGLANNGTESRMRLVVPGPDVFTGGIHAE